MAVHYYVTYDKFRNTVRVSESIDAALEETRFGTKELEAAVRAVETVREPTRWDRPAPKQPGFPNQYDGSKFLIAKFEGTFKAGSVLLLQPGRPAYVAENRQLALYFIIGAYLEDKPEWNTIAANWLGLVVEALPNDLLTYLLTRRGLALHWIEERVRCQVPYSMVQL
jgi:hypothetical protein